MPTSVERLKFLNKCYWFIKPWGSFCQRAIIEEMVRMGADDVETAGGTILYKGETIPGIHVGKRYPIVEWLNTGRKNLEGFEVWHADFPDGPWEKWKKEIGSERRKAKKKVPRGLKEKGAMMFRQRSRRRK